ncbi:hypothetical protein [Streptomyces sp. NPDC005166]
MKAYRKTSTRDPYCVYFTADEAAEVMNEAADACNIGYPLGTEFPELRRLLVKLNAVYGSKETKRA